MEESLPKSGPVAQLGARFHGMEEVIGSIPIRSTIISSKEVQKSPETGENCRFPRFSVQVRPG